MILINSSPKDALKIFQPFLPIFVPVGLGCLLSAAEKEKIHVRHIDQQIEGDIFKMIEEYTKEMQPPYIFGFSVLTAALKEALSVSAELKKKYPGSFVIFGGVHPTAMPEEILSYEQVDVVDRRRGEGID
jgi:magnesium-protoporphyrin IX monomethyl ester (oxidative) cyclase